MPQVTDTTNTPRVINPLNPDPNQGKEEPVYSELRSVKQAADNINGGREHGHTPEVYNQVKESMAQEDAEKMPTGPAPYVDRRISSEDHEALMGPDGEKMGYVEGLIQYAKNIKNGTELQHDVHNIAAKLADNEELTIEEMEIYDNNKYELSKIPTPEKLGMDGGTEFVGQLLGVGYNFALDLADESPLIAGAAGVGFVLGGAMGAMSPVPGGLLAGGYGGATTMATMTTAFAALPRAAFRQGRGAVYEELENSAMMQHPDPVVAEQRRQRMSRGAGMVMGILSYVPISKISSKIPGLSKILSPKAFLKSKFATGKAADLLMDIGQSGLVEGLEEGGQEITQILTKATADAFDGTETSFVQGVKNAAVDWETYKRTGKSMLLGTVAGGTFTAAGVPIDKGIDKVKSVVGLPTKEFKQIKVSTDDAVETKPIVPPSDISGNAKTLTVGEQSVRAIRLAEALKLSFDQHRGTNSNTHTPDMSKEMMQDMFDNDGMSNVYIDPEVLTEWVGDDPNKVKAVQPLVDGADVKGHGGNSDIQIPTSDYMTLVYRFEDAITIAKADPEAASPVQVKTRVEGERANANPETAPDTNVIEDVYGEGPYIKEESNPDITQAKEEVVAAVAESPETHRVSNIIEANEKLNKELARKELVESPKNISIAEDFTENTRLIEGLTKEQQGRVNKGLPAYSIDPMSVNPGTLSRYLNDPIIKRRSVFTEGGISADEAVALFGVRDIDHLLGILSTTPTTEESIRNKVNAEKAAAENKVQPHSKLVSAYNKMTKLYLSAVKDMKKLEGNEDYRSTSARKMRSKAKESVNETKLKDLNPNLAKVAERRSSRKSKEATDSGDNRAAIEQMENAAQNAQLAKETHAAIGAINRAFDLMARLRTDELQGVLKDAGVTYLNVVNSILNMYSFTPGKMSDKDIGAYNKFVDKMRKDFKADFRMSEDTMAWLAPTAKLEDMTVGQIKYLDTLLNGVLTQASLENAMLAETLSKDVSTVDLIADDVHQSLFNHKNYDPEKAKALPTKTNLTQDWTEFYNTADLSMTNLNFLAQRLDGGIIGGKFSEEVYQRMMGTGKHDNGKHGHTATVKLSARIGKQFKKMIDETVGRYAFSMLGSIEVHVPEFEGIRELGNGKLSKGKLVTILANLGNEGNKQAVSNWGVDPEKVLEICIRELGEKEFDFVQKAIWDQYADLRPLIEENQKASGGMDLEWTEAEPFEAFGKTYAGGHFPIKYDLDGDMNAVIERQAKQIDRTFNKEADFKANPYAGMMHSPHTKERTGKDWKISIDPLNISIGFDEVIHDVTMRIPVIDTMKIIQHPLVRKDISSIVGSEGYRMIFDHVAEQNHSLSASNTILYRDTSNLVRHSISGLMDGFSTNHILFSPRSALMSGMALPTVALRMGGVNATKYLGKASALLIVPSSKKKDLYALTAEIDPSINAKREGGDDLVNSAVDRYMFSERAWKNQGYNFLRESGHMMSKTGYHLTLGVADACLKNVVALAAYMQYKAGDAPGFPVEKIQQMTPEELHDAAKGYAEQFSATTTMRSDQLSKASLQKVPFVGQTITKFWNEVRNARGVSMNALSRFKADSDGAVQAWRDGDQAQASLKMRGMGLTAARYVFASMAYQAISNFAASGNMFADDETEGEHVPWSDDFAAFPSFIERSLTTPTGLLKTVVAPPIGSAVIAGQITYAAASNGGAFHLPVTKALEDFPITMKTIGHMSTDIFVGGLTLQEAVQGMSRKEARSFVASIGYLTPLKLPSSAFFQITDYMEREDLSLEDMAANSAAVLGSIASWLNVFDPEKDPEDMSIEELMAEAESYDPNSKPTAQEQAVEQVKAIRDKMLPPQDNEVLSDEGYETIKMAESTGDWRAKNEATGAFGYYQFLESTWKKIMNHPEGRKLGLTELDRFSRDPKYQEKAARFLMKDNAKVLRNKKIPVNIETLYHAWHFGPDATGKVYGGKKDSTKLKLSARVKADNEWLVEKKINTIGKMKEYIRERLEAGKDQL